MAMPCASRLSLLVATVLTDRLRAGESGRVSFRRQRADARGEQHGQPGSVRCRDRQSVFDREGRCRAGSGDELTAIHPSERPSRAAADVLGRMRL